MRFYGLPYESVLDMGASEFSELWEAVTVIEAQEMLAAMRVADWPNMKKEQRSKFHRQLYTKAYPNFNQGIQARSTEEIARILKGRLGRG